MNVTLSRIAAIAVLGIICFATLSPIGLRPQTGHVGLERIAAFTLLGLLLAASFRQRLDRVAIAVVLLAMALEALQLVVPTRHGEVSEALLKSGGGLIGVGLFATWLAIKRYLRIGNVDS